MSESETGTGRRRAALVVVVAALVALAGGAVYLLAGGDDDSTVAGSGPGEGSAPDGVLSGPGTGLPDGLVVAPGSALMGPAIVDEVDANGRPTSWFAAVLVEGDPIEVWSAYAEQLAGLFPDDEIDAAAAPGCRPPEAPGTSELCTLSAEAPVEGGRRTLSASLDSAPGDVTGSYVLVLDVSSLEGAGYAEEGAGYADGDGFDPWPGGEAPAPEPARPRPEVGGPLAPETVAYEGDAEEYVLLEGSELVAQYSSGSLTGGFGVLLRVTGGADVDAVAGAYAQQAAQWDDEPAPPDVVEHDGTTVTVHHPPGGAGGYQGEVTAVDRPTGDDYIRYELVND